MKNNQHTPAPWVVAPSSKKGNGTAWRDIHSLGGVFSPAYVGEALAQDAQLMASAPDLLAALEKAVDMYEAAIPGECIGPDEQEVIDAGRAAIAKARGSV
jgi:hypothetical protein